MRDSYLQQTHGRLPSTNGRNATIVISCDNAYFIEYFQSFIYSLDASQNNIPVHLHVTNADLSIEGRIEEISSNLSTTELTWTTSPSTSFSWLGHKQIYYAAARFMLAHEIVRCTEKPVLCLDVDGIVRGPILPVFELALGDADALVFWRSHKLAEKRVLASAIGFAPTANGIRLLDVVARTIHMALAINPRYHIDQAILAFAMEWLQRLRRLRTNQMPKSLTDYDFAPDSIIWTAKGAKKDSNLFKESLNRTEEHTKNT